VSFVRILLALALLTVATLVGGADSPVPTVGERIYRGGILPSGEPVRGERASGLGLEGAAAACVNCHRRSGLGASEGRILIPPITSKYLFHPRNKDSAADPDAMAMPMTAPGMRPETLLPPDRSAYTDATLARAIREGIGADGHPFDYLMPRFRLDDEAMAWLIAYLKRLSKLPIPGISDDTLQFATIITPDAEPVKRRGTLDVLEQFFGNKNMFFRGESPPLHASRNIHYRIARKWQLHVWELTGAPDSWEQQLTERLRKEPVFAVISGVGGRTWAPVHRFCEQAAIPCLFPNVDAPIVAEKDFYSIYFSKGVLLESRLIARRLRDQRTPAAGKRDQPALRRVVQVFRSGDIGEEAAADLRTALSTLGVEAVNRELKPGADETSLRNATADTGAGDALVLWLRPDDIAALPPEPPAATAVFVSGIMGGLEGTPLAAPWRRTARLTYPFDLPDLRRVRMNYPLGWFQIKKIPVVAERTQTDTYLACVILAETLGPMLDNFVRDHLIERMESELSKRILNGYYPRLGLAPGQRFASKGGYIVGFDATRPDRVFAETDWITP